MINSLTDAVSRLRQRRQQRSGTTPTTTAGSDVNHPVGNDLWLTEQDVDQIFEANDLADLDPWETLDSEPDTQAQSNEEQPQ